MNALSATEEKAKDQAGWEHCFCRQSGLDTSKLGHKARVYKPQKKASSPV